MHAVVVFGCRVRASGRLSRALERRLCRALTLLRGDLAAHAVVSGGDRAGPPEAPAMREWLVNQGVEAERIHIEARARVTAENALYVAPILADLGVTRVSLVTDAFHMRRSLVLLRAALRRYGLAIRVLPIRVDDEKRGVERGLLAVREWHKTLWSLARLYLTSGAPGR